MIQIQLYQIELQMYQIFGYQWDLSKLKETQFGQKGQFNGQKVTEKAKYGLLSNENKPNCSCTKYLFANKICQSLIRNIWTKRPIKWPKSDWKGQIRTSFRYKQIQLLMSLLPTLHVKESEPECILYMLFYHCSFHKFFFEAI